MSPSGKNRQRRRDTSRYLTSCHWELFHWELKQPEHESDTSSYPSTEVNNVCSLIPPHVNCHHCMATWTGRTAAVRPSARYSTAVWAATLQCRRNALGCLVGRRYNDKSECINITKWKQFNKQITTDTKTKHSTPNSSTTTEQRASTNCHK